MILPRIVLDTNIGLDIFVFKDPGCHEIHRALKDETVVAVTNDACREEWLRVLDYEHLQLDACSQARCAAEFDAIVSRIESPALSHVRLPACSDTDDQKFLELARDAKAHFLITKDKALLKLHKKVASSGLFRIIPPSKWIHPLRP